MHKEVITEKIKFSIVSSKDLVLSLDRLTRFKYPEVKYYRVFSELLCKYLISPKLSKKEILQLDTDVLKSIVEKIWNESVSFYSPDVKPDFGFNKTLRQEIENTYILNEDISNLVDIDININGVLPLVKKFNTIALNLKRLLLAQNDYSDLTALRERYNLCFPVEKILLCEGVTEEILMPKFASIAGYNFDKYGVKLVSAGGKNQVEKLYCELKDELKIPIFILLDADAAQTASRIHSVLRDKDRIYLIHHGEFEDIFSLNLIKRTINNSYKNICECRISDFKYDAPMTKILTEFFRINNLGDYQKADFAKKVFENTKTQKDLTQEIVDIVYQIKNL